MLTEERQSEIIKIVNQKGAVTVTDLAVLFTTSPSTIRRDLTYLASRKILNKVFGGATSRTTDLLNEETMEIKTKKNMDTKVRLARYAASLVSPGDLVFIDAGTTTEQLASFLREKHASYVTNNIPLSLTLAKQGFKVRLLGGEVKSTTEAVVGSETRMTIQRFNFNIGFFGANGITIREGFTTPDMEEADGKATAVQHCKTPYVLVDSSKFGLITGVCFAPLQVATIITDKLPNSNKEIKKYTKVLEVDAQ